MLEEEEKFVNHEPKVSDFETSQMGLLVQQRMDFWPIRVLLVHSNLYQAHGKWQGDRLIQVPQIRDITKNDK